MKIMNAQKYNKPGRNVYFNIKFLRNKAVIISKPPDKITSSKVGIKLAILKSSIKSDPRPVIRNTEQIL